jgi:hypothetical protein
MLHSRFGHFKLENWIIVTDFDIRISDLPRLDMWAVNLEFDGDFTQVPAIKWKNGVNCERESTRNLWQSAQGWQH